MVVAFSAPVTDEKGLSVKFFGSHQLYLQMPALGPVNCEASWIVMATGTGPSHQRMERDDTVVASPGLEHSPGLQEAQDNPLGAALYPALGSCLSSVGILLSDTEPRVPWFSVSVVLSVVFQSSPC